MRRLTLFAAFALLAVLGLASVADARGGDRNRDRLPDRWERAHHLSLKVNQARRDQDRDGLNNRGEFRAHMNPRDDDSDNDGIEDGQEHAGTITSFAVEDGVPILTIKLAQGDELLAARVDDDTEIECHGAAQSSSQSGDDDHSDGQGDDDHSGHGAGEREDGDDRNDGDDDAEDRCGTEALKEGTIVHEAELEATSDGKHWEELELIVS